MTEAPTKAAFGVAAVVAILTVACESSAQTSDRPSFVGASLPACNDDPSWRCGTVSVPLDRDHASQATIRVAFYVRSHSDAEHPALEPILTTPGGPGASIWAQRDGPGGRAWRARHDTVLIERRGVGQSGGILCAALQGGGTPPEGLSATSACAAHLGAAAHRYGT